MPGRILVVDDDPIMCEVAVATLRSGGYEAYAVVDPEHAVPALTAGSWDLVLTDVEMPGLDGLELLRRLRARFGDLPVIVMTGNGQVDYAMTALRERASEFLLKPLEPAVLLATVERVLAEAATRPRGQVVLAIGAHADDVEIGCGGTLARHIQHGDTVVVLALSAGRADAAVAEATLAAEVLGARLRLGHLRPTEITDGRVTIAAIEHAIEELSPSIVYTHSEHDDDPDHRNTSRATMIAARLVDEVLAYETSSTTVGFQPNRFVDISGHLGTKLTAVDSYGSHRAGDVVTATARYWSRSGAGEHVEALQVLRSSSF